MKRMFVGFLVFGVIAATATVAAAEPDDSQRLRGLGGRDFAVHVTGILEGNELAFDNCYTFESNGVWLDPLFAAPGTWVQHSVGTATAYTGSASAPVLPGITVHIVQEGEVTPAQGGGVLQLIAHNVIFLTVEGYGEIPLGELTSVGHETDSCAVD
jgi:hypothetical protein